MASVYAIRGTTGAYSDRKQWPVAAFLDKAQAEKRLQDLEKWCREAGCHSTIAGRNDPSSRRIWEAWEKRAEKIVDSYEERGDYRDSYPMGNPFDPAMPRPEYSGVDYWVEEIALEGA